MSNFVELVVLVAGVVTIGMITLALPRPIKASLLAATFLAVIVGIFSQPVLADVNEEALTEEQQKFQETLRTSPSGTQYQGLEYATTRGEPLSDRQIENEIRSKAPSGLKFAVSNGSVRLSGRVSDRQAAQNLIKSIKEIPGVHEVSYDLGLDSKA